MGLLGRIALLILYAVLAACLLGPPVTWFVGEASRAVPEWTWLEGYTLDQVMARILMVVVILGLIVGRPQLGTPSPRKVGLWPDRKRIKVFWVSFGLVVLLLTLMSTVLLWTGGRRIGATFSTSRIAIKISEGLIGAVLIGVFEEFFFRGVVFGVLSTKFRILPAAIMSSVVYSLLHFMDAEAPIVMDGFGPAAGFGALGALGVSLFDRFGSLWLQALGLIIAGMCFCYTYSKSRNLFLPAGLHAGWVFFFKIDGLFLRRLDAGLPRWWIGGSRLIDGLYWQIPILVTLIVFAVLVHKPKLIVHTQPKVEKERYRGSWDADDDD